MMMQLREQAERFGLNVHDKNVESVDTSSRPFKVTVEGEDFFAHSLIVCTGAESIWLDAPGEAEQKGRGISTCATCDGAFFREEEVLVIGGGDLLAKKQPSSLVLLRRSRWFIVEMCSEPRPSCTNVLRTIRRLRSKPSVKSRNG